MLKRFTREAKKTIAILVMLAVPAGVAAFGTQVHVQIATAKLKKSPQWFSATVAEPVLGDSLYVIKLTGDWYKVKAGNTMGWIHKSAVTGKKAKKSRASTVGSAQTSADDVTLAGKGFNELEADYRKSGGTVNLEAIDAMESRTVDEAKLVEFLRKGELLPKSTKRQVTEKELNKVKTRKGALLPKSAKRGKK